MLRNLVEFKISETWECLLWLLRVYKHIDRNDVPNGRVFTNIYSKCAKCIKLWLCSFICLFCHIVFSFLTKSVFLFSSLLYPCFPLFLFFISFFSFYAVWSILLGRSECLELSIQTFETLAWLCVQDHDGLIGHFQFYCLYGEMAVARSLISVYKIKFTWSLHDKQMYPLLCFRWLKIVTRLPTVIKLRCRRTCNLYNITNKLLTTCMMLQYRHIYGGKIFFSIFQHWIIAQIPFIHLV